MHNNSYGLALGILSLLFICAMAKILFRRRMKMNETQYDERQISVQGNAYKCAYLTLLISLFLAELSVEVFGILSIKPFTLIFACAILSLAVFVTICILMDAYFTRKTNKSGAIILFLVLGGVNLIAGIRQLNGSDESAWISLGVAFLLLYVCVLLILKTIRERGGVDE